MQSEQKLWNHSKKTCHVTDMKIWSELNSSTWKNKSCQSCNNIQEKSSESSICEFLKIEWFNIREFIKLKANTIDLSSIEYDENEIREVQQLIVSQIFKNYLRFQIDFRVSKDQVSVFSFLQFSDFNKLIANQIEVMLMNEEFKHMNWR